MPSSENAYKKKATNMMVIATETVPPNLARAIFHAYFSPTTIFFICFDFCIFFRSLTLALRVLIFIFKSIG